MGRSYRFSFPPYPVGWFQVDYSDELEVGEVKPLEYFGRDMVLFRAEDGTAHVLDAFCPHLGAHLGHGGTVDATEDGTSCITCPFHGWKFDAKAWADSQARHAYD